MAGQLPQAQPARIAHLVVQLQQAPERAFVVSPQAEYQHRRAEIVGGDAGARPEIAPAGGVVPVSFFDISAGQLGDGGDHQGGEAATRIECVGVAGDVDGQLLQQPCRSAGQPRQHRQSDRPRSRSAAPSSLPQRRSSTQVRRDASQRATAWPRILALPPRPGRPARRRRSASRRARRFSTGPTDRRHHVLEIVRQPGMADPRFQIFETQRRRHLAPAGDRADAPRRGAPRRSDCAVRRKPSRDLPRRRRSTRAIHQPAQVRLAEEFPQPFVVGHQAESGSVAKMSVWRDGARSGGSAEAVRRTLGAFHAAAPVRSTPSE